MRSKFFYLRLLAEIFMTEKKETASERKRRAKSRSAARTTSRTAKKVTTKRATRTTAPKKSSRPTTSSRTGQGARAGQRKNTNGAPQKKGRRNDRGRGGKGRRNNTLQTNAERILSITQKEDLSGGRKVPPVKKGTLRIIPIGGNEEVGRNMNIFEYENDIVIVDIGMQFPEEDMPGIDYIVPNANYLKGKEKNIRAVIFTHGHLDHIGAAPILLKQLGYPPVIARDLTLALIKKKMEDIDPGSTDHMKTVSIKDMDRAVRLGNFRAHFFEVEHSIMDSMGVALESPAGTPIHLGDWTISKDPVDGKIITYDQLKDFPAPRILMLESLGSIKTKPSSEKIVQGNLETLIDQAPGRIIIGTFASQIKRVNLLLAYAEKVGRKVALDGYSMKTNVEVAKQLGYMNHSKELLIPINDIDKYPANKVLVLCTGAQGEHNAVLNRIVTDNHRFIKVKKDDTIVFSSSIIPGNERSIQRLKDNLYRKCDNVIHSDIMDIHMGGHSVAGDIQEVIKMVDPQYFLPVYANHFMLKEAAKRAVEIGYPEDKIFVLDNGGVIEFDGKNANVLKQKADSSYVFIDGLGVGDVGHVVLRDRQMLSADGMFVITALIDSKTKNIVGNLQVTSRGFIVVKDNFDLINDTKRKVKKIIEDSTSRDTRLDWKHVENNIRDRVGEFLFQKTQRRPMVLPVVIEV